MFTLKQIFLLSLVLISANTQKSEISIENGDITAKAVGQSGKILVRKTQGVGNETETNDIVIDFDSLVEVDANGTEVGNGQQTKHKIGSFATVNFNLTASNATYQNLSTTHFNMKASQIQGLATVFSGDVYIFKEAGSIKNGNQTVNVQNGTMKFSVGISGWEFCDNVTANCPQGKNNETGNYLDFNLNIKGKANATQKNNNFELGGAEMILFDSVTIDGKAVKFPEGYPKYSNNGNKQNFAFRFPRFNSSLSYDPLITFEAEETSSNTLIYIIIAVAAVLILGGAGFYFLKRGKADAKNNQFIEN